MGNGSKKWDDIYRKRQYANQENDCWLEKHTIFLEQSKDIPVLDLGCGNGHNSIYLIDKGYQVIACDFSKEAIKVIKERIPEANTWLFDLRNGLPFKNHSAKVIIADLSLHYFNWKKTKEIRDEIFRVLDKNGFLLCRVNSTNDIHYGAGIGDMIEENYYRLGNCYKRFFDEKQLKELFKNTSILFLKETKILRFTKGKMAWEVVVQNNL